MITISWEKVNTNDFVNGMVKLHKSTQLDGKSSYRIGRLFQACAKAMDECQKKEAELKAKYLKVVDGVTVQEFKDEASRLSFEGEFKTILQSNSLVAKVHPIDFNVLGGVKGLTGSEMIALEPIISNIPEVA